MRRNLLLFTACTLAGAAMSGAALAQSATTTVEPTVIPGVGAPSGDDSYEIKKVRIHYEKLLLKDKDLPSAITVLTKKDIDRVNPTMGSVQTLLAQSPSVVAYSQGPGQSAPTLAIRGVKNDELAETLDGVPLTSFLGGSGDYLSNNIGSPITLNELDGVNVYPGVAPPEDSGFGTVGGTVAYQSLQPTDKRYFELEGGFGSFDTQHIGFTANTGKIGSGIDAPKAIIMYDQSQTAGYVSQTPAQYHDFLFNVEKPFDDGLSTVGLLIIYNQGKGSVQTSPTPTALIDSNKWTYNFPRNLGYYNQAGQFLTTILSDHSYINPYMDFEGSLFYMHYSDTVDSYCAPETTDGEFPYTVNVQCATNFYGDVGPSTYHYSPGYFTYDPTATFGSVANGESSEYTTGWGNRVGITPRLNIHLPYNTIAIGGLIGKESASGNQYIYGSDLAQENQIDGYNSFALGGGEQRTVYIGYISDKIDLLNDKLHIEPGARVTAAYTSSIIQMSSYYQGVKYQNFTKVGEPYLSVIYDAPFHLEPYATFGKSSLFSPVADYAGGLSGLSGTTHAPTPEIVHMFEGGLRYDTPNLYLSADYYYQNITDAFSFFENYSLGEFYYANQGGMLLRGVEVAGKAKVTPEISLSGNFSYNNTDYTQSNWAFVTLQNDQFGYAYKGTPLSNTPTYLANMAVDYDKGPFSAELSAQYTGRENQTTDVIVKGCKLDADGTPNAACEEPISGATITDLFNTNDPSFILNFNASYSIPVPAYSKLQSLKLTFTALNFTNVKYYTYKYNAEEPYNGIYSVNPLYESGLIGPPRSLQLDVVAKF